MLVCTLALSINASALSKDEIVYKLFTDDSGVLYKNGLVYSKDAKSMYPADVPSITSGGVKYVQIKMRSEEHTV